ncbi:hypothetical protein [Bacillus toyonensis]|uniref:hypothetical protein n=1 Tax=Bacillus toyonensis TaxID=155322 RepID=UPI000BED7872|nr:hypothetical protein [Bacillus toyonensis]PEE30790.1 hypothetical protein CON98_07410 [Bacillus toyonensis]PEF79901.1 hypothetical protein CON80_18135 [Bacillus toyonensis]PFY27819.1 hypothetical protein COL44_03730 [Bacillus toyonensis]PGB06464.1 hypothetical protein COM09_32915 [Bacillus toyonensis]PHC07526.1 hypothetical protein COF04_00075 [Bacillus toyonensis]
MALNRWLTNEEYEVARSNGISRKALYMRVYTYGWELQEALKIPPRAYWHIGEGKFNKLLKVAKENGIIPSTFYGRVNSGWDPQEAAIIPVRKQNDRKNWAKIAEENGISASTFRSRVATYGWDLKKAATTPARNKKAKKNIS